MQSLGNVYAKPSYPYSVKQSSFFFPNRQDVLNFNTTNKFLQLVNWNCKLLLTFLKRFIIPIFFHFIISLYFRPLLKDHVNLFQYSSKSYFVVVLQSFITMILISFNGQSMDSLCTFYFYIQLSFSFCSQLISAEYFWLFPSHVSNTI